MQIQDYHRLSIITKKIAEQREVLCQESVHEQAVTWKGNFYVVNWRLSFDLISNRFNIEVMCLSSFKNENGLFTWPKNVQREIDANVLREKITVFATRKPRPSGRGGSVASVWVAFLT